ncbi:WD40 repeat-like protein [Pleurotus eryngii]|uniref:WD40 repeat-like protein n=1 Tax=Pleurotus eryngii TaxID=5323 RepID=A0A9P5ZUM9_PLEER|nr:WD40 repeat-like protein [Pleurotus eryngii]
MPFKAITELPMPKGVSLRALTFGDNARILVTGNSDNHIRVWDVGKSRYRQTICDPEQSWGQVMTLVWADQPQQVGLEASPMLCVGSGRGVIGMVPFSKGYEAITTGITNTSAFPLDHPVESIAYNSADRRVVAVSHFGQIKGYRVLPSNTLEPLWQAPPCSHIPIGLAFWGPQNDKVVATLLQSGEITCYSSATGMIDWRKRLSGAIGGSVLSQDSSKLLVNNLTTHNFDLYTFPELSKLRTFTVPKTSTSHRIKMGIFSGASDELVLCGSLHDKIYLFDTMTGACLEQLVHGQDAYHKLVQMLATDCKHAPLFASGSSGKMCIWKDTMVAPTVRVDTAETNGALKLLRLLINTRFLVILLGLHVTHSTWHPYTAQMYHSYVYPVIAWHSRARITADA